MQKRIGAAEELTEREEHKNSRNPYDNAPPVRDSERERTLSKTGGALSCREYENEGIERGTRQGKTNYNKDTVLPIRSG